MICSTTLRPSPQPTVEPAPKAVHQSSFLVVGYGNELRGDEAAGLIVGETVASWALPFTNAVAVRQLTDKLALEVAAADYVIFVTACGNNSSSRTLQLTPLEQGTQTFQELSLKGIHSCNPLSLLNLAQSAHGRKPQAWFLQVPIESVDNERQLSSLAKRGCDRAVRTVEKFLRTYQRPAWIG